MKTSDIINATFTETKERFDGITMPIEDLFKLQSLKRVIAQNKQVAIELFEAGCLDSAFWIYDSSLNQTEVDLLTQQLSIF